MWRVTSFVPMAASPVLRAISRVVADCSSTAALMAVETLSISLIDAWMSEMAATDWRLILLHGGDLLADFLGGFRGLTRERLHLCGDHRKAAAGLACPRAFDGGVKGQEVGLGGDIRDERHHLADLVGGLRQLDHDFAGAARLHDARGRHLRGLCDLARDFADCLFQFSVELATCETLVVACSAAAETAMALPLVASAMADIERAVCSSSVAAAATVVTMLPTDCSNLPATSCMARCLAASPSSR
jgi:hypothetical protein